MKTLAIIRLHRFSYRLPMVFDAIGEHADGILFLAHDVLDPEILRAAARHPKSLGVRVYNPPTDPRWLRVPPVGRLWTNRDSLATAYRLADKIKPEYVLTFDEDEVPPARFGEEFAKWQGMGIPVMLFRWLWSWGVPDVVVAGIPRSLRWHCKVVRWQAGLGRGAFPYCIPGPYLSKKHYQCPYPMRHLQIITAEVQAARKEKKWSSKYPVVKYDPDVTFAEFVTNARIASKTLNSLTRAEAIANAT